MARRTSTTVGDIAQVKDLTGGVNLRTGETNIRPEQARRLVNALIGTPGELGVYPGYSLFSTSSLGARRAQGGRRVYLTGGNFTLVADNGSAYKPNDSGVWGSAVLTGLHASNPVDFPFDRNMVAAFDASTVPKKTTDGSTWTQLGITQPAAPTLALVAGGSLVADDQLEISYAYRDDELAHTSNSTNTALVTPTGGNLTVRVSHTASADSQVDKIKIYVRDVTAGETVRRLAATVANATTTTDLTANTWDAQEEAPTDHSVSVAMSFGTTWKNRWWGRDATVGNRLRFTQIFQGQSWPSDYYVDLPLARGENITAVLPLGDILVVFGYTEFYLIIGQTSLDFEVRPALGVQTGAFGTRAVTLLENGIAHAGAPGLYLYNGATDELLTHRIEPAWRSAIALAAPSELTVLPIVYHQASKELRVAVPNVHPTGARGEWILDLNRTNVPDEKGVSSGPAWCATTRTIGGYLVWDGPETTTGNQGRIFSWDVATIQLYEERTGTSANGGNITMEYDGFALPFGLQRARVVDSYIEHSLADGTLTVDLKVDGTLMGTQSFSLGGTMSRYGTATYGVSAYAGSVGRTTLPVVWPLEAEGVAAQLLIKYVGTGDLKLYTYGHNTFREPVPRGF